MDRRIALLLILTGLNGALRAQALGFLVGARSTTVNAAGVAFAPSHGMSVGLFVPFYVNDRIVVRTEAGLCMQWWQRNDDGYARQEPRTQAELALLCRYYLTPRIAAGGGLLGSVRVSGGDGPLAHVEQGPNRADLAILFAASFRFNERFELGARYGEGLLPVAELAVYGTAHHRMAQLTMSYLLHPGHTIFMVRRHWHSALGGTLRY